MSRIVFPETWEKDVWYGFTRHKFTFEGHNAWIVEPVTPAPDNRWSWCMQWADAFVKRVGTVALLEHGFYHVHINVFEYRANPEGLAIMGRFHEFLVSMGLSPKANLIGMSWGGFFSLRYAGTFPERVCAIYLDAPLCNAAEIDPTGKDENIQRHNKNFCDYFKMTLDELKDSKLNPINNLKPIADAKIPIFAAIGMTDCSVAHESNFDIVEQRLQEMGGNIVKVIRRNYWGHHPHGLDDVSELLDFHWRAREN